MERSATRSNHGFTLVEVLIVIVILGVLATAVVLSVTGVADRGQSSVCASDHATLANAEEAFAAEKAVYGTMAELVAAGRLHAPSAVFNVNVNGAGAGYTLTGVAECVGFVPG
jgi:prepilin-type N-terminal cleavage/methylation domain-containing protein